MDEAPPPFTEHVDEVDLVARDTSLRDKIQSKDGGPVELQPKIEKDAADLVRRNIEQQQDPAPATVEMLSMEELLQKRSDASMQAPRGVAPRGVCSLSAVGSCWQSKLNKTSRQKCMNCPSWKRM